MLTWIVTKMSALKGYLIAAGLFVVGIVASLIVGRAKQHASDTAQAQKVVSNELDKLRQKATAVQNDVSSLPPTGPDSASQQLRDDWSDR